MFDTAHAASALCTYLNAPQGDEYAAQCALAAHEMLTRLIGSAKVPDAVYAQALNEVGANLYQRRNHARDTGTGLGLDGSPAFFRPALDPLTPAYPLIRPYLGTVIA